MGSARFPAYGTARLILAKSLADDGDSDGALAEVQVILDASPADAPAHRLAGELHRRAGRLAEALPHVRQVVALDPTDRESRMVLEVLGGAGAPSEGSALRRLLAEETFVTSELRRRLPRAGPGGRGGADLRAPPPEGPGRHPGPGAARRGAPNQDTATEGAITRCRSPRRSSRRASRSSSTAQPYTHRRLPARQARQGRRLRAHQAQAHAARPGHRQHVSGR